MKFQRDPSPTIDIPRDVLDRIEALAKDSKEHETGGILIGFNDGRNIQLTVASDPGPNAKRSASHFLRDTEYCRKCLADEYAHTGADYVGEWHSHVVSLRRLSGGDLQTLAGLFVDPDYDFVTFAIVLVVADKTELELHVYVAERLSGSSITRIEITELYRGPFPDS